MGNKMGKVGKTDSFLLVFYNKWGLGGVGISRETGLNNEWRELEVVKNGTILLSRF